MLKRISHQETGGSSRHGRSCSACFTNGESKPPQVVTFSCCMSESWGQLCDWAWICICKASVKRSQELQLIKTSIVFCIWPQKAAEVQWLHSCVLHRLSCWSLSPARDLYLGKSTTSQSVSCCRFTLITHQHSALCSFQVMFFFSFLVP